MTTTAQKLSEIVSAIRDYHFALDTRQHGGVAANRAISRIEATLEMPWTQGAESARRSGEAERPQASKD